MELYVQHIEFKGRNKSDVAMFEVGKMIDYQFVLNKKSDYQIRPKSRFLFISSIMVTMKLLPNKKPQLTCEVNVFNVVTQPNFKKDPKILKAITKLKNQFGEQHGFDKSPNAVLAVVHLDSFSDLKIQNLAADWNRL